MLRRRSKEDPTPPPVEEKKPLDAAILLEALGRTLEAPPGAVREVELTLGSYGFSCKILERETSRNLSKIVRTVAWKQGRATLAEAVQAALAEAARYDES